MTNLLKPTMLAMAMALQTCNQVPNRAGAPGQPPPKKPTTPIQASEVDPSLAIGGLMLLAGVLTVMRGRRRS